MEKKKAPNEDAPSILPSQANEYYKDKQFSSHGIAQSKVLSLLQTGRIVSVVQATKELNISDFRSAVRYLRNAGVPISDVWVKSKYSRYKLYFIHNQEEREVNNG